MQMNVLHPLHVAAADGVSPAVPTATIENYSSSASFTSAAFYVGSALGFSLSFSTPDAAADGSVKLQCCNDPSAMNPQLGDANLVNWADLDFKNSSGASITSQTVSGQSLIVFEKSDCYFRWIRLVYTRNSGTASFTARVQCKGIS